MKTTHVLFSVAGVTIVSSSLFSCQQKQEQKYKPYNIVYIMTDDHTAQMMSCYDRRYVHTPNLDRIASDGVRFANSFVANSLSGPSRACMLTGKHSCGNKFTTIVLAYLMVLSRLSRKFCVKTVIRQQLSGSGTWKVFLLDSIIGKLFPVRVITTIRILLT